MLRGVFLASLSACLMASTAYAGGLGAVGFEPGTTGDSSSGGKFIHKSTKKVPTVADVAEQVKPGNYMELASFPLGGSHNYQAALAPKIGSYRTGNYKIVGYVGPEGPADVDDLIHRVRSVMIQQLGVRTVQVSTEPTLKPSSVSVFRENN